MQQVIVIFLADVNPFLSQINEFHKFNLLKPAQYFRESISKTLQLLSFLQPSQTLTMGQGGEHWDTQRRNQWVLPAHLQEVCCFRHLPTCADS